MSKQHANKTMVNRNKFKGRKLAHTEVAFYTECVVRNVYTANDTPIAPFLNHALDANAQQHIMSFLGDVRINAAYYEDSMFYDEQCYCDQEYAEDFTVEHHIGQQLKGKGSY
jgi:hypothetical protein